MNFTIVGKPLLEIYLQTTMCHIDRSMLALADKKMEIDAYVYFEV